METTADRDTTTEESDMETLEESFSRIFGNLHCGDYGSHVVSVDQTAGTEIVRCRLEFNAVARPARRVTIFVADHFERVELTEMLSIICLRVEGAEGPDNEIVIDFLE